MEVQQWLNKADNQIKWVLNKMPKSDDKQVANMSPGGDVESKTISTRASLSIQLHLLQDFRIWPEYLGLKKLYV